VATSDGIFEGDGGKVCDQPDGWGTGEVEVARSGRVRHGQTLEAVPWRGVYKAPLKLATQVLDSNYFDDQNASSEVWQDSAHGQEPENVLIRYSSSWL
jgi:hypothetical protein